jgi:hypothetical protein
VDERLVDEDDACHLCREAAPESEEPEPEAHSDADLTLVERVRGGKNEVGGGATTQLPWFLSVASLPPNSWGAGLPSFWCAALPEVPAVPGKPRQRQYLVREEHGALFDEEFPDFAGGNMLALPGGAIEKATLERNLVTCEPPAGAVVNTQARRPERFDNERVRLTEAGVSDLERGVRKNLIVWGRRSRCGGINTYVCVSKTAICASPDAAAVSVGRSLEEGDTVVAADIKLVAGRLWIRVGPGWACCVDIVTGVVKARAAGCKRQCGGVGQCAATCSKQVKARHECDLWCKKERPLELVPHGLVRITVNGEHTPVHAEWAPMPLQNRKISVGTRQAILKLQAQKVTAKQMQKQLNHAARGTGTATDERYGLAVTDRSVVPDKRKIQQVLTNHARAGRQDSKGKPIKAFKVADGIIRCDISSHPFRHTLVLC